VRPGLVVAFSLCALLAAPARADNPWARVRTPKDGPPAAVGGYSAGCLLGAARLPNRGPGFRVARPGRGRVFGHPILIGFLREVAARVKALGLAPLVIGDLSQPRGGPAPSGHASHQTGLDADLYYSAGRGGGAVVMADLTRKQPTPAFTPRVMRLLEAVASDARVERLFVNPILKQALCARPEGERGWLHKVRPWWGHHEHFHVRLACPADSTACTPQEPIAEGDGCAEIEWWLGPAAEAERAQERDKYQKKVGAAPELPAPCAAVLE
jgi:penicillin-insensitive murein endopeptidase